MNELIKLEYEGKPVRTVEISSEPWWVLTDICEILELTNPREVASRLDDDEKNTVRNTDGIPGNPNMNVVNESGLYHTIFMSNKSEAKKFRKWVTSEVLPQIRKTGMYIPDSLIVSGDLIPRLKELCEKFNVDPAKRTEEMIRDFLLEVYVKSDMKKEKRKVKARRDETTCRIILPDELVYRLGEIAKSKEVSPDEIVEDVITDWLNGDGYEIWKKDWVK